MERKVIIPRRRVSVPETLVIPPPGPSDIIALGSESISLPLNEQATHLRSKAFSLQPGRGGGPSHEVRTGRNRSLSLPKYWIGGGVLQSPRLHGFAPREVNAFEQQKSLVERIPEENDTEGENKDGANGEGEELVFDMGESGLGDAKSSAGGWRASDGVASMVLVSDTGSSGRRFPPPDWPLPLLPGIGILPDKIHPSSATGKPPLQNIQGPNILTQQAPVTTVSEELPPSPVFPRLQVSPLLPPPSLEERSRLVSITPSLIAELELEELEGRALGVENTKAPGIPRAGSREVSGKLAADVPILSPFSTDTGEDPTENEPEGEKGQAGCLPLQAVPRQLLNLVEIDSGDPAVGRKRSVRKTPVLGKSKLAQKWEKGSSYWNDSGPGSSSHPTQAQGRPQLLDRRRANHKRQSNPPFGQGSPGIHPNPLSGAAFYEGYALRFKSGVYIPLNMTTPPLAVDQSLLYMVVPKKEISDGTGRAYHIIQPNGVNQSITSPGLRLYAYDEASRGFVLAQAADPILEGENDGRDSVSSIKEIQWPTPVDGSKVEERLEHQQPQTQQKDSGNRPQELSAYTPSSTGKEGSRIYNGPLIDPRYWQPTIRRKEAKLLGLGGGTSEIGNIEHVKASGRGNSVKVQAEKRGEAAKRSSRSTASGECECGGDRGDMAGNDGGHGSEGEGFTENGIYVTKEFEVDAMHAPTEVPAKERGIASVPRVSSDTDVKTGKRRREMNLNGQSWLEVAGDPTTTPAAKDTGEWREAVELSIMRGGEAVSPIEHMQAFENTAAFNTIPRLPIYKPPKEMDNEQMHSPVPSTLTTPVPPPEPRDPTNISQSHTTASPLPPLPHSHRKRYVTLTLNLHRSRNQPPRTTRILIPVSPTIRGFDDQKVFREIKKEYIAMTGGEWRAWCGLRGIKWVGINEVRT